MSLWRRAMVGVFLLALALPDAAPATSIRGHSAFHPSSLSVQPFSATRNEWVAALELRAGEELATRDGRVRVESVARRPGTFRVYNLEVETEHCYFAGKAQILSHNNNPCAVPSNQGGERAISMDEAVERAAAHVDGRGVMETTGRGNNYQFRTTQRTPTGEIETRIGRFDVNPADAHVQRDGPHPNVQTQINGETILNDHIPVETSTVRSGDVP